MSNGSVEILLEIGMRGISNKWKIETNETTVQKKEWMTCCAVSWMTVQSLVKIQQKRVKWKNNLKYDTRRMLKIWDSFSLKVISTANRSV